MKIFVSSYWILGTALWYFINGILHDIFVIKKHQGGYDRELLRLLMDGHVLILSGAVMFVCYVMFQQKIMYGAMVAIIVLAFMLTYCAMIFPFLKSFGTILISAVTILVSVNWLMNYTALK